MTMPLAFERLKRDVVARTGHHYYADKDMLLYERVRERMKARGLTSMDAYVDLLGEGEGGEWRALEDAITIGETYFFRYTDHFDTLRRAILPALIAARKETKALRIWSIGCANGAEPYSLAIVLRELLGDDADDWRITLIGGDISEQALEAARAARYTDWALRTMGPEDRKLYFTRDDSRWILKPEYRRMARFERQNILELLSPTPPLQWTDFDLILCRNVLIYFSPEQAIAIMHALRQRLSADGSLLLGHAEATLLADPQPWAASGSPTEFGLAVLPPAQAAPYAPLIPPPQPTMAARQVAPAPAAPAPEADLAEVQRLADAGAYEQAARLSQSLIEKNPTSPRFQYYDAVLRQVSDDIVGAEAALRRALYLDRSFVLAHHRLGMLLLAMGRTDDARRSLLTAMRLAEAAPSAEPLPESHGVPAGELSAALRRQLDSIGMAA